MMNNVPDSILQPESWVKDGDAVPGEPQGTLLENVNLSAEAAIVKVQPTIEQLGLDYLVLASAEKARLIDSRSTKTISEGWSLHYGRGDAGYIPVDLSAYAGNLYRRVQAEHAAPWRAESLHVYVDGNGIQWLQWENPLEVVDTIDENASLLSFPEVQSRIKQQLKNEWSWIEERNSSYDPTQTVFKLVLSFSLVPVKNDLEAAMIMPTWYVYYCYTDNMDFGSVLPSILAMNAIDGSVVNPVPLLENQGETMHIN